MHISQVTNLQRSGQETEQLNYCNKHFDLGTVIPVYLLNGNE